MIIRLMVFLAAAAFEAGAFAWLMTEYAPLAKINLFLLLHLIASLVFAVAVWPWLPSRYRKPPAPTFAFLVVFSFFTPGLAACAIIVFAFAARLLGVRIARNPFRRLHLPEYSGGAAAPPPNYGPGGIRARLSGKGVATEARVETMLLAQAMPGRLTNALWRSLLSDRLDDIRLVAYQTLDAREKRLNRSILEREKLLACERDPAARALLIKQLAELSWEMLYDGLAEGAVADFIRAKLSTLVHEGLQADPDDPDLWLLQGRLALSGDDLAVAEHAFIRSLERGMPRARVVPYIAELAFDRQDWKRARELMRSIPAHTFAMSLAPHVAMWQGHQV